MWQSIENAPRDGTIIVGWDDKNNFPYICSWKDYHPDSTAGRLYILGEGRKGDFYSTWESKYRNTAIPVKPTLWQLLIAPAEEIK